MLSNMQLARQPLRQALKVGFVAFMLCWLVGAVQVLPILSLHQDFGHRHPPDTPFHTHALTLVFQVATVAVVIIGIPSVLYAPYKEPSYLSPYTRNLALLGFDTRAPPRPTLRNSSYALSLRNLADYHSPLEAALGLLRLAPTT